MSEKLSRIEESLERSVFHLFRKRIISFGYLPDINDYNIENEDIDIAESEQIRYNAKLKDIEKEKGFCIELFNFANNQYYGDKKPPRIVIQTESFLQGQLGLDTSLQYEKDSNGVFKSTQSDSMLSDFYFNLHLVASTVEQMRTLHEIMVKTLPRRGYIPWYNKNKLDHDHNLMVRYINMGDFSWLAEGIIEKVYRYEIPDAHEVDKWIIEEGISPIKQIDVKINDNDNIEIP